MNSLQVLAIFGFMLVISIHSGSALWCYTCNSGKTYDGETCADDKLSNDHLTDCGELTKKTGLNYTMCRKQHQKVEGETRIFRDCAVTGNNECARRTGTKEITLIYCECNGDKCNSANTVFNPIVTYFSIIVSIVVSFQLFKS